MVFLGLFMVLFLKILYKFAKRAIDIQKIRLLFLDLVTWPESQCAVCGGFKNCKSLFSLRYNNFWSEYKLYFWTLLWIIDWRNKLYLTSQQTSHTTCKDHIIHDTYLSFFILRMWDKHYILLKHEMQDNNKLNQHKFLKAWFFC